MIIWKCDGCGRTLETQFAVAMESIYSSYMTRTPAPPEDWWIAWVKLPEQRPSFRRAKDAYHACCGTCADKTDRANPKLKLHWEHYRGP